MPEIEIKCPECGLSKKVPSERIPDKPVKVSCKRCANNFVFDKSKDHQKSVAHQDIVSAPLQQPKNRPAPARSKVATGSAASDADRSNPEMVPAQTPPKKKSQALVAVLLLMVIACVPLRIWLTNQANSTPYPNWMATSARGLAVLFGDQFHVLDYEGNIQWSKELPDDTDACQISWHGEEVWVSDWKNERILQFHGNGMSEVSLKDSAIEVHMNVAVDPIDSNLYIADSQASKIKIYDDNGDYVDEFGQGGYSDGSLNFPKDITFNKEGQLIIGNTMRSSVDVFSTDGTYVETLIQHVNNPLEKIKALSPEALREGGVKQLKSILHRQFIYDFAMGNQNLATIECDQLVTACEIVSYSLDGNVQASIEHQPGTDTEGDVAIWQDKLFVSNCVNRNIDVYDASTLSYQGAFSPQIDQIGISFQKRAKLYRISSKVLLYLMILSFIPIIWLYIRSKRT